MMTPLGNSPGAPKALTDTPLDSGANSRHRSTVFLVVVTLLVILVVWRLNAVGQYETANYILVMLVGVVTGATELMSRFRDRPFDALVSKPGLIYMAVNGGAGALALHLLIRWDVGPDDEAQQVLLAGISSLAVFRSGVFTTKIGGRDINLGPNLLLQSILDALDRAYDRERASRRAQLIAQLMGGLDFTEAKASLPEFCFSLLQNVRPEEREAFGRELERIAALAGMSDEAKSMALGLNLMGIVGEDTLRAAGNNLGSTIFRFQPLSRDIVTEIAKPSQEHVIDNLFAICNSISHKRAQLSDEAIDTILSAVRKLTSLAPTSQAMLLAFVARQQYGEKALIHALRMLPNKPQSQEIPAAPPPPPPAPTGVAPAPAPTPTPTPTPTPAPAATEPGETPEGESGPENPADSRRDDDAQ